MQWTFEKGGVSVLSTLLWPKGRMLVLLLIPLVAFVSCSEDDPAAPSNDPACRLSDDALDFGAVAIGGSRELSCTIKNTGGGHSLEMSARLVLTTLSYQAAAPSRSAQAIRSS